MSYVDRLSPWCIVRTLPNLQGITVARFRRRGDAEAHLGALSRLIPDAQFKIMFDPALEPQQPSKVRVG
ncbi:hypothetical protein H6F93_22555 [Leptolyngbya sp. FACHB-671]|uniref:hypothetical protein n=1 Tax=Leptolyngbya sp. FACHB-671 TaxID=2692812 RepID=UPI0016838213|nr:hypothetical protein [Leptolyngbya sp. FACHB-671]MBD2070258.1 hypothetical protein [Leptolyngbya sp. FACHB-671]